MKFISSQRLFMSQHSATLSSMYMKEKTICILFIQVQIYHG